MSNNKFKSATNPELASVNRSLQAEVSASERHGLTNPSIFDDAPLYAQIRAFIVARMHQGEWQPGERIPAENALAQEYDVSLGTVRKALDSLVENRVLIRHQGRGTFVSSHNSYKKLFHFFNIVPNQGARVIPETDNMSVVLRQATDNELMALNLPHGAEVVCIERLRYISGVPIIYELASICAHRFAKVLEMDINMIMNNLYEFYEQHFGVIVLRAEDEISAIEADNKLAEYLHIDAGKALLCIKRLTVDLEEIPVEYREIFCLTDNHYYSGKVL